MAAEDGAEAADVGTNWSDVRPRKPADELVSYVKSVGGSLSSALDGDERAALLRNVFEELHGHEASLACSRRTSYVLEALLKEANARQLSGVMEQCKAYFGFLCSNRQGSHVVQSVLTRAFALLFGAAGAETNTNSDTNAGDEDGEEDKEEEEDDEEEEDTAAEKTAKAKLRELVADLCRLIVSKGLWWDMLFDPCATHVLRSLISLLAGKDPSPLKGKKKRATHEENFGASRGRTSTSGDSELTASLHSFLVDMTKWEASDVKRACGDAQASPVIQLVLQYTSPRHKSWSVVLLKLLGAAEGASECDPAVFAQFTRDPVASHAMQIIIKSCDNKTFGEFFFDSCFKGNMVALCEHRVANFVLQSGLACLRTQQQFEEALEELESELTASLLHNKLGVVWRLCQAAQHGTKQSQSQLCRAVVRGIRARAASGRHGSGGGGGGAIELLLELKVAENNASEDAGDANAEGSDGKDKPAGEETGFPAFERVSVSLVGAKVASALLELPPEASRTVLESIAGMSAAALKQCCMDPVAGKQVMETLMDAPVAAAWVKQRVLQKLKDEIAALATNRFGWHVIRKAYDSGTPKERTIVVKALAKKERRIAGSTQGAKLLKHCKVTLFKKSPDQWEAATKHSGTKKRKALLDGMLDDLNAVAASGKRAKSG